MTSAGIGQLLTILGALGLFLYGMKVMSEALILLAGGRMRRILATATANRFYALLTGVLMTAAIQSSSATTMMVVSFVNANLLTLSEAIGVIMGANVGTTITAWLISLLGFKVSMSSIALPLLGFGFLLSLARNKTAKHWGEFTIGFALLFVGLEYLKESLPDEDHYSDFLQALKTYTNSGFLSILLFLVVGTLLTMVVQSSSASMALTLLMSYQGWLTMDMAAAMVLGQNIGTTITANLAALMANIEAKRAALAHLIFNLLGVTWILMIFHPFISLVDYLVQLMGLHSATTDPQSMPIALAVFHTCFNLLSVILMIGFIPQLEKLVTLLFKTREQPEKPIDEAVYLDQASLSYVTTGIKALTDESVRLLENAAYEVLAHGLWIHRSALESEQQFADINRETPMIPIDIELIYAAKIKSIYSQILEYSTELQSRFNLTQKQVETIRNILIADRLLIQVVKRIKPLHDNLDKYMESDNDAIRREYNHLRRSILKVVKDIKQIGPTENLASCLDGLKYEREKARHIDVLLTGRVEELLRNREITREMATSLMNDSSNASRIIKNLIDVAVILYSPLDEVLQSIDEQSSSHLSQS